MAEFIGALIRKTRKEKGLTNKEVAKALGLHISTLSFIEHNEQGVPHWWRHTQRIADVLGLDHDRVFEACKRDVIRRDMTFLRELLKYDDELANLYVRSLELFATNESWAAMLKKCLTRAIMFPEAYYEHK